MSIRTSRQRSIVVFAATVGLLAAVALPAWALPPVPAVNGFGTGPASSASTAVTPRTVPGAPRSLGMICPSATRAKISWSAPSSNGGASITKYQVRFKDKVTGRYTAWANTTGRSLTKAGLIKNRSYMVQVRAVNVAGPGSAASKTFKQLK